MRAAAIAGAITTAIWIFYFVLITWILILLIQLLRQQIRKNNLILSNGDQQAVAGSSSPTHRDAESPAPRT